jgi:hypothetical protein
MKILISNNLRETLSPTDLLLMVSMPPEMAIKRFPIFIDLLDKSIVYRLEDDPLNLLGEENKNYKLFKK